MNKSKEWETTIRLYSLPPLPFVLRCIDPEQEREASRLAAQHVTYMGPAMAEDAEVA